MTILSVVLQLCQDWCICWACRQIWLTYWATADYIYSIPSTIASTVSPSGKRFTRREALPLMSSRESLWWRWRTSTCSSSPLLRVSAAPSFSAYSSNLKGTSRSRHSPTGASLRLVKVTSSSFYFYIIDCIVLRNLHEGFKLLQVGYCCRLLLLCLMTLYLVTGLGCQDATFR